MGYQTRNLQQSIEMINGSPRYVATVAFSGSVATQQLVKNSCYLVQADPGNACVIHGCVDGAGNIQPAPTTETASKPATTALTTGNGIVLAAAEKYVITLRGDESYLGVISSASGNLNIFLLEPAPFGAMT